MKPSGRHSADETLAASLAAGKTITASATAAGVGESTVYRRLKCPEFTARVRELRAAMVASALGKLTDSMSKAADALTGLLANRDPDVRHRAAVKVIELALRVREQAEIEERLSAVERQLQGDANEQPDPGADQAGGEGDADGD